ncbi:GNAT family N-acetyltransferase [Bacillus salacetis]|uniref:GNAT family N-acetyltransferase n=1 Tax=Bacillus salacetis TaxID=2315464 RepID=A0A3A1R8T9_9BACI|nr:GNAT family N-acetyltransferase [Bacillus salacetis]RIW37370.1 GNAT family N-acetyltransferase [Bacillus salacetis]
MTIYIEKLVKPTQAIAESFNRWENDPALIPLIRPSQSIEELNRRQEVTVEELTKRLENHKYFLIYLDDLLVGEMNYMVDPGHLFKKEEGTAWMGITIGEAEGRGKGVGYLAVEHLANQARNEGLKRVELGVFEFNEQAFRLYEKSGFKKIGVVRDFTYWQGRMWNDIRMEKYL